MNVAGLSNKIELASTLPYGLWGLTETQLTEGGQRRAKSAMRQCASLERPAPRMVFGAGAPSRTVNSDAGTWTGVGFLSDFPIHSLPVCWPGTEYDCGRVMVSSACVGATQLISAVIYGFAQSPSHTDPLGKSQLLLRAVTEEVVMRARGPRCIMGDFNSGVMELPDTAIWRSLGWQELQLHSLAMHHKPVEPTCKNATVRDFVWCSPELLSFWDSTQLLHHMFPDHSGVSGLFRFPASRVDTWHWTLPKPIPWTDVDVSSWHADVADTWTPYEWTSDTSHSFSLWSCRVEKSIGAFVKSPDAALPPGVQGRGQTLKTRKGPMHQPRARPSRQGEVSLLQAFPNSTLLRWFKQLRRLQSLLHGCRNGTVGVNAGTYQAQCWSSIVRATGFRPSFCSWWLRRPIKLQNCVVELAGLPTLPQLQLIYDDFLLNFRRLEAWYGRQQAKMAQLQKESCSRVLFRALKPEGAEPLCFLTRAKEYVVEDVDIPTGAVSVDVNVDFQVGQWTLQGERIVPRPLVKL
eukprot:Skav224898  [mRNA]  locus=scaffold1112:405811:407437:+ [translate_table: standard]